MSDRDQSRDQEMVLKSQHSFSSESGRMSVPMWDSSDPDRAPPPLPINPGTAQSPTTRPNASAGIAAAAKQLVERARDSAPVSSYTTNHTPQTSPERSLIKGAHHKRMQSLQSASVRDLRSYLDGQRSQERSPERASPKGSATPYSRTESKDHLPSSPEKSPERASTPTPTSRDPLKETPTLRPSTRQPPRAILGENTPPSATMLALQTMRVPGDDQPFNDITNSSTSRPSVIMGDGFSSQLLHLTTIATSLQREMAQLSRRSKDNATDLISLKEATNARDEDIRKSLKELVGSVNSSAQGLLGQPPPPSGMARSNSSFGINVPHFLDAKPFNSPPSASKSYSIPTAASALSFLESERSGTPNPFSVEGAASVAMLEKIIREMVTKEGQERLLSTLSELLEKSSKDNVEAARKVEELADFIKEKSDSHALVVAKPGDAPTKLELKFDSPAGGVLTNVSRGENMEQKSGFEAEIMKLLQRVRDSVATSGGMTAEVKTLVRDLRGEVLGMGRRLGEQMDKISEAHSSNTDRAIEAAQQQAPSTELRDVENIIRESLAELREHMQQILSEAENASKVVMRAQPNGEEMYAVVKHALAEHGSEASQRQPEQRGTDTLDRESILQAVKEACKDFEPNIELQQFGLEREEILQVLKEGLKEYQMSKPEPEQGTNMDEVHDAIQKAIQDFQPPSLADHVSEMKEELLSSIRDALQETDRGPVDSDATRAAIIEAIKETLAAHGPHAPREIEISRDDLFDAVKASLDGTTIPFGGFGEQVLNQLHELIDGMRVEFRQYSAANGRDTEQVLDAVKDGLESLRAEIESYVDRAQDVTGKDEIVDTVKAGLEQLRGEVQNYVLQGPTGDNKVIDYIKAEFEHLHEVVGARDLQAGGEEEATTGSKVEIVAALEALKEHVSSRGLDDDATDEMLEAMKEEFDQLKAAITSASSCDKAEIIEHIQDSIGSLHAKIGGSELSNEAAGQVIEALKEEFVHLRQTLATTLVRSGETADTDAIMAGVKTAVDDLRTQLTSNQSEQSAEALGAIKEEIENLKSSLGSSLVLSGAASSSEESFAAIRSMLEEFRKTATKDTGIGVTDDMLEAVRGEFESLRTSIASSVVHGGGNNEEVLDAVRLGLDDLRSHMEKKLENRELAMNLTSEVLDSLNDGLENLKTEVVKTLDKPLDMTVNYEILDTLKDGLASLRSDMDRLRAEKESSRPNTPKCGEIVLADSADGAVSRELPIESAAPAEAAGDFKHNDLEKIEVLFAQLQIKVEAMDATVQDVLAQHPPTQPADGAAMKVDLLVLEEMLKEVQSTLAAVASREQAGPEGAARKEDTDAIETLLRNTKAQIDEIQVVLPGAESAFNKEHLDSVEAVVRVTNEAIDGLAEKIESNLATKADVAVVEVLTQDLKTALEELKEQSTHLDQDEDDKKVTKADLDVLGILCTEIKSKVDEMVLPDPETLPSKADIGQLIGLVADFRDSHDKMKDSYETDIAVTAKAFDDRKKEFEETVQQIGDIKTLLVEVKEELVTKMSEGESGINTLGETLKGIEENVGGGSDAVKADVKELMETVVREFERSHGSLEGMKVDHEQIASTTLEKHAEYRDSVVAEVSQNLDRCFDGLMTKYDDAQLAAQGKAEAMEEKVAQQEDLMNNTKKMADELRVSIDTLGTSLTTFTGTFTDATDKMAQDSKTVFNRVDDTYNKLDETQLGLVGEHQATREEIGKAMAAIGGLQGDFTEFHPRFMVTLQELLALVGQHYEHSKKATDAAPEHVQAIRELQDQVRAGFGETKEQAEGIRGQTEELKTNLTSGFSNLPALMPPAHLEPERELHEKYDDSAVHDKLDRLMGQATEANNASAQLDRLDEIHKQVMATAAEVSAFVAVQTREITEDHSSKEKEAEEVALLLERRQVQKDQIEAEITVLNEEKDSLRTTVEAIRAEKESLISQKAKLSAVVSSLETALTIRREELHVMDAKADALERRVLEGIMNQSRLMLMTKGSKPAAKKPADRDLRVPSNSSTTSHDTLKSSTAPGLKANHALALQGRPQARRNGALSNTTERRIMSLSQINNNVPTGGQPYPSVTPSLLSTDPQAFKRSHSVKTHSTRKSSWGGRRNLSLSAHNKENEISEESEGELNHNASRGGGQAYAGSEIGTERVTDFSNSTPTESRMTYGDGSYTDGITPGIDEGRRMSYGTSDMSYGTGSYVTGSYLTGSELDRRTSLGSTVAGTVGDRDAIEEEPTEDGDAIDHSRAEEPEEPHVSKPLQIEPALAEEGKKHGSFYAPPSDSGLGTDLPTTALSAIGGEYFGRAE